jgi:Raf kinase inhibitor-like YbhB/YbcL family protein
MSTRERAFLTFVMIVLVAVNFMGPLSAAENSGRRALELKSSAFQSGGDIPRKHTCDANDVSPQLSWSKAPAGTRAFALIVDDPDAPAGTWVHWVIYDLPADTKELAEGVPTTEALTNGAKQGTNDFRKIGYGGPCPPPGLPHRYFFKLYALDVPTGLKTRASKQQLLKAIENHVLGEAEMIGRYKR